ncbi:MAG: ComEC/Rec2 family competence protein [Clostridia bacterium]|nr:ComEC/Rec2 family competence protein [Clostridia bacterium]
MTKRPLCLAALMLILGMIIARWMGMSWIWRSPEGTAPELWAAGENDTITQGIIYKQEEKIYQDQIYTYLYLKHTILSIQSKIYPIRNIKCILKGAQENNYLGCTLRISGKLVIPKEPRNPGEFDQQAYERARKIDFYLEDANVDEIVKETGGFLAFFDGVRKSCAKIMEEVFPIKEAGVLESMILGEKSQLEEEIKEQYQAAGISHIIAISGLHISLLGLGIWSVLKRVGMPVGLSAFFSILILMGYGCMIGSPTTAVRALIMFGTMLGARICGRAYDLFSALALSAILLLVDNPDLLWDSGFQLSFMAVAGMGCYGAVYKGDEKKKQTKEKERDRQSIGKKTKMNEKIHKIVENLQIGIFLWLFTLPVVLHSFYQVSLVGIACNLLVLPLLPVVLGSGVLAMVVGKWHIGGGSIMGIAAYGILRIYEYVSDLAEKSSIGMWTPGQPKNGVIILYYLILGAGLLWRVWVRQSADQKKSHIVEKSTLYKVIYRMPQISLAAMLVILMAAPWSSPRRVTMLDVGQGDGIVIQEKGLNVLIDGGSTSKSKVGSYVILPFLKQQGISNLDGIFLTHTDQDHINGVMEILEEAKKGWLTVEYVFMPGWMSAAEEGIKLEKAAQMAGAVCDYLKAGDEVRMGAMKFHILHPQGEEKFEDPNDGSMVLLWENKQIKGLFTGDFPMQEEENLLEKMGECDFLKVAHHGSRYSTGEALLAKIQPETAIISAGINNRYGHPHKETVERLKDRKIRVWCTAQAGAITIESGGKEPKVKAFIALPPKI